MLEDYYKPVRIGNFWSRNYIEYESNGDRNKTLSIEEYLNKIRPYLKNIKNNLRKSGTCKFQLTIAIKFMSFKDNGEERIMVSKSDNIEIMSHDKPDETIEDLFESILSRYQIGLETSTKDSDFIFDCIISLYYKFHKVNLNNSGSYVDSPDWMKSKKARKIP